MHQDLNAIITGPGRGVFDPASSVHPTAPNRHWPFREFTIIYHDEIGAVQAFPHFEDGHPSNLEFTLHGSRDAFAINYGTGGIGAEILANRLGVGPMKDCQECLFEEFFLSAWTVGDPAMVVDRPANAPCDPESIHHGRCSGTRRNRSTMCRRDSKPTKPSTRQTLQRPSQLPRRPHADAHPARRAERASHPPPARAPVAQVG